jgi:C-terminal processing protease CtpA/Prc
MLIESEYYITSRMSIFPTRSFTSLRTDFTGQIWLLTDGNSASMSEWVTAIMKMNDLAIIVGERTAGIFGVPGFGGGVILPLPHTGMLIEYDFAYVYDRDGRPLSDGIDPDYWNKPGMDALETALALINDGAYR